VLLNPNELPRAGIATGPSRTKTGMCNSQLEVVELVTRKQSGTSADRDKDRKIVSKPMASWRHDYGQVLRIPRDQPVSRADATFVEQVLAAVWWDRCGRMG